MNTQSPGTRTRVLFVVNRCKHIHIGYMRAISEHLEHCQVIISYHQIPDWMQTMGVLDENDALPVIDVLNEQPVSEADMDIEVFGRAIEKAIRQCDPDIIHVLPYLHDKLVIRTREVLDGIGHRARIVYETRDPSGLTGSELPEEQGISAADGYITVSEEMVDYFFNRYLIDLSPYLVIRQSEFYNHRGSFSRKLSGRDGRAHVVLMGTFSNDPDTCRHYEHFIRQFLTHTENTVFHIHPHGSAELDYYLRLQDAFGDRFRHHAVVPEVSFFAERYTPTISQYDFNIVGHSLFREHNARELLRYCNPTKATSPLILADLPFLCSTHYRGIAELIGKYRCGYVYRNWSELNRLLNQPRRWPKLNVGASEAAQDLCLESQAKRIVDFYQIV